MSRSELTIDLGALRRNVVTLQRTLDGAELWAVVKADAYGHGAVDVSRAALEAGARALCVVTAAEALELRGAFPDARILCMGPLEPSELAAVRDANVEVAVAGGEIPEGVRVHLKLDTGMGRFGLGELVSPTRDVVGLMSHLATAERVRAAAARALSRSSTRRTAAVRLPHREQRRGSADPGSALTTRRAAGSRSTVCRRSRETPRPTVSSRCCTGRAGSRR